MSTQPSLRIERFSVQNFRTFGAPVTVPLDAGHDKLIVFHGENGSGKSNALAALDLFFQAALYWLRGPTTTDGTVRVAYAEDPAAPRIVRRRDWPPGVQHDPMIIEARFADAALGDLRVQLQPSGMEFGLTLQSQRVYDSGTQKWGSTPGAWNPLHPMERDTVRSKLETPHGVESTAFYWLDARRRQRSTRSSSGKPEVVSESPLSSAMLDRLFEQKQSLDPREREKWRALSGLLGRFAGLRDYTLDFRGLPSALSLTLEQQGRQVLVHTELSSGEQQILGVCAAILTSGASVVVIEEPDMSLSQTSQKVLREVLTEQISRGLLDQIIIESHVPAFDGADVVRFEREPVGWTTVSTGPSDDETSQRARAAHGAPQWVTLDGFTQLPDKMRSELHVEKGGELWFLKDESGKHWRAWTAPEVDELVGVRAKDEEKK
jgi:energy-coupling factor transporter ATP-binding protein EcfA2